MFLVRYLVACAKCQAEATLVTLRAPFPSFVPTLPGGWHEGAPGCFYCPLHTVTITTTVIVDGMAVAE